MSKQCPNCHKPIDGKRGDAKFCSRECQNAYAYKLRKGQVKGLEGLSELKIIKPDLTEKENLNQKVEPKIEPETKEPPQALPPYKTPTVDSDAIQDFLGDAQIDADFGQDSTKDDSTEPEIKADDKPLPEKYITKPISTPNPDLAATQKQLQNSQNLKQRLEQEYARLEAELKIQQRRDGTDIVKAGAAGAGLFGFIGVPLTHKEPEKKNEIILKDKNGKPILRSTKGKKYKKIEKDPKSPSFWERLGNALVLGALGAAVGFAAKSVTDDWREKDKKEKIAAINKRMEEIRKEYATLNYTISNTQKQLGQIPLFLLSSKTVINPEYEKALSAKATAKDLRKARKPIEPSRFKSDKVIRATDLDNQKFSALDFKGIWCEFFGQPSTNFHFLVHGNSGEGKSTFCLWFAKYLAENFGVVLYVSGEEGTNKTFYDKLKYCSAQVKDLHILDVRTGDEFMQEINENEAHFIFLDSLHDMDIDAEKLKQIFQKYKNSAFICIDQNNKKGDLLGAGEKKYIVDAVVNIKNYIAETTKNRFKEKGMIFKTKDFPGSEKRNVSIKPIKKDDKRDGYDMNSDRRGVV